MPGRPPNARPRGPVAASPAAAPTGYRVTPRRKFELVGAMNFVGESTLQGVIDVAVTEFLDRMRERPGYAQALRDAEREQQRRASVRPLKD